MGFPFPLLSLLAGSKMPRLVVIAGPERSGKMPLARKLMSEDPDLVLVHRDHLRDSFESKVNEGHITMLMGDLVCGILRVGRSPIVVAWNLEVTDRRLWTSISDMFDISLQWFDVTEPAVAILIPRLETA